MKSFQVSYHLTLFEEETIDSKIEQICLEQSVELPRTVIAGDIAENVVGEPVEKNQLSEDVYEVTIRWALMNIGHDITAFLNLLYGNISLKPGIRIDWVEWQQLPENLFKGPSLGIKGLREQYDIYDRPLSSTALKPLGSNPDKLGYLCYHFAKGGIDIIKDDHNLMNQKYAPFRKRVESCVAAVHKAADESGYRARYFANVTADGPELLKRYRQAAELGADGVLVCPHICGLPGLHELREAELSLPIMAHPSFSGTMVNKNNEGFAPAFLYGQLWRALGADVAIYPNVGGRFSFSLSQCEAINEAARTRTEEWPYQAVFPAPAGGLKLTNIEKWKNAYGPDTVFLMGGSLYEYPDGIEQAAYKFSEILER